MPQINRIRVNNVRYNFGTQFYDDFVMRFSCKNSIYDLANGGGKSVLMLLMLQNLIPNCTLDEKQPVEKLFRTGNGSNTIHSLIEWKLDGENNKNNYKYMLTGFCARKAKDEEGSEETDNASVEYFNYCIFYREFNDNDLKNLPLSNGKERITYNGLKSYLRELEKKDFSLEVKIFDRKGEYQRFIAGYGLYESQWEIIRGINKTEGHVRTYFETNYKTTRKIVEDLLIEEIIEKSFYTRAAAEDGGRDAMTSAMAKTLLDIKDRLIELSRKKEDIHGYDRQIEALESFIDRISGIRQLYVGREDLEEQLIRANNTLTRIMTERERAVEEYNEQSKRLEQEKAGLYKKIDTIKVQKTENEMLAMSGRIERLEDELSVKRTEYEEKKIALLNMESENDYMDYLYYKSERDSVKAVIDSMLKGDVEREEAKLKLAAMGTERRRRNGLKRDVILRSIAEEEEALEKERLIIRENEDKENEYIRELSVAGYLSEDVEKRFTELNTAIYNKKKELDIIMNTNMEEELKRLKRAYEELCESLATIGGEAVAEALADRETEYEQESVRLKIDETEKAIEALKEELERNRSVQSKKEKMEELYGDKNIDGLIRIAEDRRRETEEMVGVVKGEQNRLTQYVENLEAGCPVGTGSEVRKVLEYIEKYHGDAAVSGNSYMRELSMEKKAEVIDRIPILPYGIVIKKDYGRIVADGGLKRILTGDYAVPLIREDMIKKDVYLFDATGITFVMRESSLFTDEEVMAREREKTLEILRDLGEKGSRLPETIEILEEDLTFLREYRERYAERIQEAQREYGDKRLLLKTLMSDREALEQKKLQTATKRDERKKLEECLLKEKQEYENKIRTVESIIELDKEADRLEKKLGTHRQNKEVLQKQYNDVTASLKAVRESAGYRETQISAMQEEIRALENDWNTLYKQYYTEVENISPYGFENLSDEEIDAKARALKEILSGALSDLKDKQRLLENYDVAMEKSLQAIDYKGVSIEELKGRHEAGTVRTHTGEELKSFKVMLESALESIGAADRELTESRTARDRLMGAVLHGKEAIAEKYGGYESIQEEAVLSDRLLRESKAAAEGIDRLLLELKNKLEDIQNTSKEYIIYKRDLDKMMESFSGGREQDGAGEDVWEDTAHLKDRLDEVSEKYEKYQNEVMARKEELESEKHTLSETLKALDSFRLAEEIRENIRMPADIRETEELIENLKETVSCIRLEKERVEKSIEDMERIKDNFENQCIQSCVNIKAELERLPKLSRINMDGEAISIIGLTIPYIREDSYKQGMADYIDEIVNGADNLKTEEERIRYIRNRLSWKNLFSVIVTDMNGIRLTLYKRERIKEQSRYLKYEEAVGSTGQSQGIYIQFLIAIINYITSINSGNAESRNIGKTIFIDNPFGAAKDIYIWEPIFKMLKTNNVQLIVPCRGATPVITGRFDVNYILGQKMKDGKQQTVVVEYYSNVESDSVEYEKLSFEQNRLVFH